MKGYLKFTSHILFKNAAIYIGTNIISMIVPFFFVPILTRFLSPQDYGIVATFRVIMAIMVLLLEMNITGAIGVNFFHMEFLEFKKYVGNAIFIIVFNTLLFSLLFYFFKTKITAYLKLSETWIFLILIFSIFQVFWRILLTILRVEQKAEFYGKLQIHQTLINILFSLIFVVVLKFGWRGRAFGIGVTSVFIGIFSIYYIWKNYLGFTIKIEYIKDALYFGIPLMPHSLSGWITTAADRLFLNNMVNLKATGLYSVGYQIGAIMRLLAMSFNKAWSPYLFGKLKGNPTYEMKIRLVKFTYMYFIIFFLGSIFISVLAPWVLKILVSKKFWGSYKFVLWIALAYSAQGMYFMVVNYVFFVKKTYILAWITFSTAIVNIILNYFLIKMNGAIGAAQATTITFFLKFFLTWILSAKVYPMPWLFWIPGRYNG